METLRKKLLALDGKGYKAYKAIAGLYQIADFDLSIDHVQGDPFATPSRISVRLAAGLAGFPEALWQTAVRRIALEDFIARAVQDGIRQHVKGRRGSGGSGEMHISVSGQQVLVRNAVAVNAEGVEARLTLGLPAQGRRAAGREAIAMLLEELPRVVKAALYHDSLDAERVRRHVQSIEDQDALRHWLASAGLVGFIADGSLLPRASGVDDRPLSRDALRFAAPASLARSVELPNAGPLRGLGIPRGITLIVGGGFHGKSTLLHALERGVYNHIPGDGRERVATLEDAVKVRAEDNRAIARVNISPFIDHLPFGRDTVSFSTENASGSTSQAANIIEALECGTRLLLIDEDTSATNFMIRDQRMQALVAADKEPITPLLHRVRELYEQHGVSSVIVMGGSGDYFDVADTVIMMDAYEPRDVTQQARALADPGVQYRSPGRPFCTPTSRRPMADVLSPARGNRAVKIDTRDTRELLYGEHRIDLSGVEQLIDSGQTRSIGLMIHYFAQHYAEEGENLLSGLRRVMADAEQQGLDVFSEYKIGNLALPRLHELAAAINRIREGHWSG
ncbi:MAG: ABC-ATPase domain-containing protein [Gammaproteobacteria bacterium]|nr:ABC-ATPase domain-containing protein [Gammaproteobacteria bacterium]